MGVMIAGLVLFIGIHLVPMAPDLRAKLASRLGDNPYRAIFSLVSAAGLVLIVVGYRMHDTAPLFAPSPAARAAAPAVVYLTIRFHPPIFGTGPVA